MGHSQSKRPAPPRERLPQMTEEDPSDYPSTHQQYRSVRHLVHLEPFFFLKVRISASKSQNGYPQGDMGLLAGTQPQTQYRPSHCPERPYSEEDFYRLNEIISHHSELGIMREETKGLSHPDTLHSFLQVAEAYYHLGQDDKAQPLLEQVYILGDDKARPEFTIQPAEMLNYIYLKKDFKKSMRALEKKALTAPPRRQK